MVTVIGVLVLLGHRAGSTTPYGFARAATTSTTSASVSSTTTATASSTTSPVPGQATASATTIASKPGATQPPKPGSSAPPPVVQGQPTATATAVPQPTLLYDFESGQVWQKLGSQLTSIVTSTDYAFDGTHSDEIKMAGLTSTTYPEAFGNQPTTIPTNAILSEEVYLPAGIGDIKAKAFVIVQNNNFYGGDYVDLAAGTWSTLRYTLPNEAFNQTAINIGVQFFAANGTINGSLYIDHVAFVPS